jgi:hypothetical protein
MQLPRTDCHACAVNIMVDRSPGDRARERVSHAPHRHRSDQGGPGNCLARAELKIARAELALLFVALSVLFALRGIRLPSAPSQTRTACAPWATWQLISCKCSAMSLLATRPLRAEQLAASTRVLHGNTG